MAFQFTLHNITRYHFVDVDQTNDFDQYVNWLKDGLAN